MFINNNEKLYTSLEYSTSDMTSISSDLLLHPELLTNDQLVSVIQERHLKVQMLTEMSRDSLLELFHQYCVPYAQRRYRDSGRGKLLNKNRQSNAGSQTVTNMEVEYTPKKGFKSVDCERMKPPPDLLTGHIKRIKLGTDTETKEPKPNGVFNWNKRKLTTFRCHSASDHLWEIQSASPLNRSPALTQTKSITHYKVDVIKDSPPVKKDRKPITWP